jgi:hypothetical protein
MANVFAYDRFGLTTVVNLNAFIMLGFPTLLDFLQRLLDRAVRFVLEFGKANQPLIECFFRPEEVNDASTAAQKEDGRSRHLGY